MRSVIDKIPENREIICPYRTHHTSTNLSCGGKKLSIRGKLDEVSRSGGPVTSRESLLERSEVRSEKLDVMWRRNTYLHCHMHLQERRGAAASASSLGSALERTSHHNCRHAEPVRRHVPVNRREVSRAALRHDERASISRTGRVPRQDVCDWLQDELPALLPMIIQLLLNRTTARLKVTDHCNQGAHWE